MVKEVYLSAGRQIGLRTRTVWLVGLFGLYAFALSGGLIVGGIQVGFALMLIALLVDFGDIWPVLRRDPLFWAAVTFGVYVLLRALVAVWEYPDTAAVARGTLHSLAIGGLGCIVVAWWLAGDPDRIRATLMLAVTGLMLGLFVNIDWGGIERYMQGERMTSVSLAPNGPGLYFMSAIIGMLTLALPGILREPNGQKRLLLLIASAVGLSVMALAFVWNQSRSAWLGAAIVFPGVLIVMMCRKPSRPLAFAAGAGVVLVGLVLLVNGSVISQRLTQEHEIIASVLRGQLDELPFTAVSERANIWVEGLQRIGERPVFGWGPGTAEMVSLQTGRTPPFKHFHSMVLQVWAELGFVGLAGFVSIWVLILMRLARASRARLASPNFTLFVAAALALFAVTSLFDLHHVDTHAMFYLVFMGALALTHWLSRVRASRRGQSVEGERRET